MRPATKTLLNMFRLKGLNYITRSATSYQVESPKGFNHCTGMAYEILVRLGFTLHDNSKLLPFHIEENAVVIVRRKMELFKLVVTRAGFSILELTQAVLDAAQAVRSFSADKLTVSISRTYVAFKHSLPPSAELTLHIRDYLVHHGYTFGPGTFVRGDISIKTNDGLPVRVG